MSAPLLPEVTDSLRRLTRPERVSFWGEKYEVEPVLVPEVFGDGAQVIGLRPLNTRPNYYVVRVDSTWSTSNWDEGKPKLIDNLDDIYESIEGWFGCVSYECDCGCDGCDVGCTCEHDCCGHDDNDWPALNDDVGSEWFWLAGAHPEAQP